MSKLAKKRLITALVIFVIVVIIAIYSVIAFSQRPIVFKDSFKVIDEKEEFEDAYSIRVSRRDETGEIRSYNNISQ